MSNPKCELRSTIAYILTISVKIPVEIPLPVADPCPTMYYLQVNPLDDLDFPGVLDVNSWCPNNGYCQSYTVNLTILLSGIADSIRIPTTFSIHFRPLSPSSATSISSFVNIARPSLYLFSPPTLQQLYFFHIAYHSEPPSLNFTLRSISRHPLPTPLRHAISSTP
eukprot:GHVP01037492.1.p1 GENE.GHVP01037492.1~~GHVP01037492.1.p1  ORF type:complete len:166 (-),score=7.80 GHVP01037492.1:496-993(-)